MPTPNSETDGHGPAFQPTDFTSFRSIMAAKTKSAVTILEDNILSNGVEIIPNRFYMTLTNAPQISNCPNFESFSIENDLLYEPFYEDFGPLNIALLHYYCELVSEKLDNPAFKDKKIVHFTSLVARNRVNAAYLIGSYAIIYLKMDPLLIYNKLCKMCRFIEFRDASTGLAQYTISLKDCLMAVAKARDCGFFNFSDFCRSEYTHYETVQNGDLNWIVPGKFLAFAGPQSLEYKNSKCYRSPASCHTPESYVPFFEALNVTTVIRLNNHCYNADKFKNAGIDHHDVIFSDGGMPSDEQLEQFLKISESAAGAVAVHCKAGLGRTGSVIACYLMKWYKFAAKEAIAWLRICRPASIIGRQQNWLMQKQTEMWIAGLNLIQPVHRYGIYSYHVGEPHMKKLRLLREKAKAAKRAALESVKKLENQVNTMNLSNNAAIKPPQDANEKYTQGDHLQQIKLERHSTVTSASRVLRSSWPMSVNAMSARRSIITAAARKTVSAGKTVLPKRTIVRKKIPAKAAEENDESVAATTTSGATASGLRRSARVGYPRSCKSMSLR